MSRDYTVRLERVFQGPMDLLLHLVREEEVEIHEIQITRIVDGYLAYLESLERLDIEVAGDFLVMAATLMSIKSRSLLPREEIDLEEEIDPKDELIQRLIEYRRFKESSEELERRYHERSRMSLRGWHGEAATSGEREFDLGELTPWDLLSTYSRLMRETLVDAPHHVAADKRPLRYYVDRVVEELRRESSPTLRHLIGALEGVEQREALIGSFCALLELVRLQLVDVLQEEGGTDIEISVRAEHAEDLEDVVRASVLDEETLAAQGAQATAEAPPAISAEGEDANGAGPDPITEA